MKALLVCEVREGKLLESSYELLGFAAAMEADPVMVMVGTEDSVPDFKGTVYLGDVASMGEYNPGEHKQLVLEAVEKEKPDYVVFSHSSYGWDLAPRVASAMTAPLRVRHRWRRYRQPETDIPWSSWATKR